MVHRLAMVHAYQSMPAQWRDRVNLDLETASHTTPPLLPFTLASTVSAALFLLSSPRHRYSCIQCSLHHVWKVSLFHEVNRGATESGRDGKVLIDNIAGKLGGTTFNDIRKFVNVGGRKMIDRKPPFPPTSLSLNFASRRPTRATNSITMEALNGWKL